MVEVYMPKCAWCDNRATHFCTACGKWICNSPTCIISSVIAGTKKIGEKILGR